MIDILFRGKRVDNGEWADGSLIIDFTKTYIIPNNNSIWVNYLKKEDESYDKHINVVVKEVIPESLGQFTGLLDKNGKKIFEGDTLISCFGSGLPFKVLFGNVDIQIYEDTYANFVCFYIEESCGTITEFGKSVEGNTNCYKIIGNIHDNPELL